MWKRSFLLNRLAERKSPFLNSMRLTVAASVSVLTLSAQVGRTGEPTLHQPVSFEQVFNRSDNHCSLSGRSCLCEQDLLRIRGGMTYLNRRSESHVGGTYGLEGILPFSDTWGAHAAARVNQFSGGTQVLGTIGGYRASNTRSGSGLDRIGATVLVDVFGDSRGGDVLLSQLRAQAGYAISDNTAAGVTMTTPMNKDSEPLFLGPGSLSGKRRAVNTGGLFVSHYIGEHLTYANVGYREDPDSLYIDAAFRTPLVGDKVFAYANGNYIANSGDFASWVGLEIRFGRSSRGMRSGRARGVWDDPTIANAFNYGENTFWHNTNDPRIRQPMDDDDGPRGDDGPFPQDN